MNLTSWTRQGKKLSQTRNKVNVIYLFNLFTLRSIFGRTHESTRTNDKKVISIVTNNELLRIDFDLGASVDNTHLMHMLAGT